MDMEYSKYVNLCKRFLYSVDGLGMNLSGCKTIFNMSRKEVERRFSRRNRQPLSRQWEDLLEWRLSLTDEEWDMILLVYKLGGYEYSEN